MAPNDAPFIVKRNGEFPAGDEGQDMVKYLRIRGGNATWQTHM
jgi:hypothetical protein